jgi:adenosine deaminase
VAREAVEDLAADGVVYAELRYAPELHLTQGLSLDGVVQAVRDGLNDGMNEAARNGRQIRATQLLTAMRQADRSEEVARLAIDHYGDGSVVGYDIAGPEAGFSVLHHRAALEALREASVPFTVHAGEGAGLASIWEAVAKGGTLRVGHGVRLVEDIAGLGIPGSPAGADGQAPHGDTGVEYAELGALANWIRDWRIPLELCPTSNLQTGAAESIATHPITPLKHLGFAVTLNTDNRLMSGTSMSLEALKLVSEAGWTLRDVMDVTLIAANNAFLHADERAALIADVIEPGWKEALEQDA